MDTKEAQNLIEDVQRRFGTGPDKLVLQALPGEFDLGQLEACLRIVSEEIESESCGLCNLLFFWHPTDRQLSLFLHLSNDAQQELSLKIIMWCSKRKTIEIPDEDFDLIYNPIQLNDIVEIQVEKSGQLVLSST